MIDKFFTTWIFVWCILYLLNIIDYNPFIILFVVNIIHIIHLIYLYNSVSTIILLEIILVISIFILLQFMIPVQLDFNDVFFTIILFSIYLFYIRTRYKKHIIEIYLEHTRDRIDNISLLNM